MYVLRLYSTKVFQGKVVIAITGKQRILRFLPIIHRVSIAKV